MLKQLGTELHKKSCQPLENPLLSTLGYIPLSGFQPDLVTIVTISGYSFTYNYLQTPWLSTTVMSSSVHVHGSVSQ